MTDCSQDCGSCGTSGCESKGNDSGISKAKLNRESRVRKVIDLEIGRAHV